MAIWSRKAMHSQWWALSEHLGRHRNVFGSGDGRNPSMFKPDTNFKQSYSAIEGFCRERPQKIQFHLQPARSDPTLEAGYT